MVSVPLEPGMPEYAPALRYAWRVCSVTSLGMLLIGMSASTLNVALPAVVRHFDASPLASNWILLAYLLVNTATLVFFGRVSDLLGRREIYLVGFALFTVASLLSGLAPGVGSLIALRAVQGLGAAMIIANGSAIMTDAFPSDRLSQGMGVYFGVLSVAQLAGPTLGGLIADLLGWRWIFWINVPAGLFAVIWGLSTLRRFPARGPRQSLDASGNLIVLAVLSATLFAVSEGSLPAGLFAGALVPVLVLVERRATNPVLDFRLLGERVLLMANLATFCNAVARASLILLAGLYFQAAQGADALTAGLGVLPVAAGMALGSPVSGALGRRVGPYALALGGSILCVAGLLILLLGSGPATQYGVLALGLFMAGCGSGTFLTGNTTQVMAGLAPENLGVVNGFRLMAMNVGVAVSVALTLGVLTSAVTPQLRAQVYAGTLSRLSPVALDQLMTGFRWTYAVLFGLAVLAAVFSALARAPRPRTPRPPRPHGPHGPHGVDG
ncbi:MFS transporter [Microtetraspora fusca]|uniref:MFS transporter n=1 Tax=Microtetraspora fusca TaxID=1997 RepID=A0ABW6V7W2_MICFU